jgi:hypothetical protein
MNCSLIEGDGGWWAVFSTPTVPEGRVWCQTKERASLLVEAATGVRLYVAPVVVH